MSKFYELLKEHGVSHMDINKVRTFEDCYIYCLSLPELVKEFNRLYKANIKVFGQYTASRTPIEIMIDEACGYLPDKFKLDDKELFAFFDFVKEFIWLRLPEEAFENL